MKKKRKKGSGKKLRNRILVAGAKLFGTITPKIPLEIVQRIGALTGSIVAALPGRRRKRTYEHLAIAYPIPPATKRLHDKLYRSTWQSFFQLVLEGAWSDAWNHKKDRERVTVENPELFRSVFAEAEAQKKGLVLFTAHIGSMELLSRWVVAELGISIMAIAGKPKIPELETLIRDRRAGGGVKMVYRGEAGVSAMRHIRKGGVFVLFADHNLKGEGVEIPVFGKPAHTLLAPARLALQSGALATTVFCLRDGYGRLRLEIDPLMSLPAYPRDEAQRLQAEIAVTKDYTQRIEAKILRHPDQYLWMHRRWEKRSETLPLPPS